MLFLAVLIGVVATETGAAYCHSTCNIICCASAQGIEGRGVMVVASSSTIRHFEQVTTIAAVFYHPVDPPPAAYDDVVGNKRHFNRAYAIAFVLVAQLLLAALLDAFLPDARTRGSG